ncbi:MAG: porin family protein [Bacteroidales bacterium]|nr:porin family protein [Bacteroidales bacterium]
MKRINKTILFLVLFPICLNSYAWKVNSDSTLYVGLWGGYSFSKISGYPLNISPYNGLCGGVSIVFAANPEFAFRSGFSIINKGFCYYNAYFDIYHNPIGNYKTFNKFTYLTIPADVSFNLGRKKFNVFLSAGFHIGFLTKQNTYANLPTTFNGNEVVPINVDNTEAFKKVNIGINAGGGIEYKIKSNLVVYAEIKYEHGLVNLYAIDTQYIIKHRNYYAGVGVRIGIPITYSTY